MTTRFLLRLFYQYFKLFLLFSQPHQLFLHVRAPEKLLVCLSQCSYKFTASCLMTVFVTERHNKTRLTISNTSYLIVTLRPRIEFCDYHAPNNGDRGRRRELYQDSKSFIPNLGNCLTLKSPENMWKPSISCWQRTIPAVKMCLKLLSLSE